MEGKNRYCYTKDAAQQIGVHKDTLLRWFRQRKVKDVCRDVRGWRIFSEKDIRRIKSYANKIIAEPSSVQRD